jgi:hypothetical protein
VLGCIKYTHWLADHNKVTQYDFIVEICSHFENYFPLHPKTDTTAQLYCTLSMCKTPKTTTHCNQKTNTPPQLYCTLSSACIFEPKPFSHQNQKLTQYTAQLEKGSSSPREASVFESPSVILSVSKG